MFYLLLATGFDLGVDRNPLTFTLHEGGLRAVAGFHAILIIIAIRRAAVG